MMLQDPHESGSEFHVATVADQKFFPGLWSTLVSASASASDLSNVTFHVVDGGIDHVSWEKLEAALANHPLPPCVKRHQLNPALLNGLPLPSGRSALSYARLLFPKMFDVKRLLYIDADLLIFDDITRIFEASSSNAGAAVLNADGETLAFDLDPKTCRRYRKDPESPYFNTGVLLMNLEYWRENDLAAECFKFLSSNNPRYVDQTAINVVANNSLTILEPKWNRLANRIEAEELKQPAFIVHFTTTKPWLVRQTHPTAALFEKFCLDTELSLGDRPYEKSPANQHLLIQSARSSCYRLLGAANRTLGRRQQADAYLRAAEYWRDFVQNRHDRKARQKVAVNQIKLTNYRPAWLQAAAVED